LYYEAVNGFKSLVLTKENLLFMKNRNSSVQSKFMDTCWNIILYLIK